MLSTVSKIEVLSEWPRNDHRWCTGHDCAKAFFATYIICEFIGKERTVWKNCIIIKPQHVGCIWDSVTIKSPSHQSSFCSTCLTGVLFYLLSYFQGSYPRGAYPDCEFSLSAGLQSHRLNFSPVFCFSAGTSSCLDSACSASFRKHFKVPMVSLELDNKEQ